ncbi:MAG TPA: hypothetical protein PKA36_08175 [Pseudoxanthomonas mexicana]|nr:hypothetical protein [Pseudoxanthomonas mexicana]
MPRARRSLTGAEILGMALNTSTARRLQGRWPEAEDRRHDSVVHTAKFLWLALGLTVVALVATITWAAWQRPEEDCQHGAGTDSRIECAQRRDGKAGREGDHVGHGAQSGRKAGGGA